MLAPLAPIADTDRMDGLFRYTCATCGTVHEGAPSVGYDAPYYYHDIPADERAARAYLSSDFCMIDDENFFIRARLEIPIHGIDETFIWGVWVSLSKTNYDKYAATFDDPNQSGRYFGWFCNRLPFYPDTLSLKTMVNCAGGNQRPWLELEPIDHPLCQDYHHGISLERAGEIFGQILHPLD